VDSHIATEEGLRREQPAKSAEPEEYGTVDGAVQEIIPNNVNTKKAEANISNSYLQHLARTNYWARR
jgi:hypothetical protein